MTSAAWRNVALHTVGAAVFGFVLLRFMLAASWEMSLLWAACFAVGAAFIAWRQNQSKG
jgi:hypothetical protein